MCRRTSNAVQPWDSSASKVLLGKGYKVQEVNGLSCPQSLLGKSGPSPMHWPVTPGLVRETQGPSIAFLLFVTQTPCHLPQN